MKKIDDRLTIFNQNKFPFITLLGGTGDLEHEKLFPLWKQRLNWFISKLLFRKSYKVAPNLWKSQKTFTETPEIFDYESERGWG
jgi:hypothetical protein